MLSTARRLLEMIRFSHTLFALPFALLAALMAWRCNSADLQFPNFVISVANDMAREAPVALPGERADRRRSQDLASPVEPIPAWRWKEVLGILFCMVAARSAAMAFNRIADRRLDALNPRTAGRHLPSGTLSLGAVVLFAVGSSAAFIAATLLFLPENPWPLYLSVPVLVFLLGYSTAKRFTMLAHCWLGAALGFAPVAAWIAIRGPVVMAHPSDLLPAIVLGAAVLCWVAGFDIIYACQDVEFDRRAGLHSIPARWGVRKALLLAAFCHLGTVDLLALLPLVYPYLGWIYLAGVAVIAALLAYEHWIVRPDDLTRVNVAFFQVNAVISLGLLAVGTLDLMLHGS